MSERIQAEAARLWRMMKQLEAQKVSSEADIAYMRKEMAKLKQAYEKVTGLLADAKSDKAKSKAKAFGQVFGGRPEHETRDTIHDYLRDSKSKA